MPTNTYIYHKGKKILLLEYTHSAPAETLAALEGSKKVIAQHPFSSVLGIMDVRGSSFDASTVSALTEFAIHNKPYMKMTAVVGASGLQRIIFSAIVKASNRNNIALFDTMEEAADFLSQH